MLRVYRQTELSGASGAQTLGSQTHVLPGLGDSRGSAESKHSYYQLLPAPF